MRADLLRDNFDTLIQAPEDAKALEAAALDLAVRGKLAPQDPGDEPATQLLAQIRAERRRLVRNGEVPRAIDSSPVTDAEAPYQIPPTWVWCRIPEIYRDWGQGAPDGPFTYIDVSSVDNERGVIQQDLTVMQADEAPSRARKYVRKGSVIYSTVRPYLLNVAIVDRDISPEPIVSTAFEVMHPFPGVDATYLYYYLRSKPFTKFVGSQMAGMAYPAISKSKFQLGLFALPPLAEQKRIVERLDELLERIHRLVDELQATDHLLKPMMQASFRALVEAPDAAARQEAWQRVLDGFEVLTSDPRTIDVLKQTILDLAVRGMLVRQNPADEPASTMLQAISRERGQIFDASACELEKRSTASNGNGNGVNYALPNGWVLAKLDCIADLGSGVAKGRNLSGHETQTVSYLRVANVQRGYLDLSEIKTITIKAGEEAKYALKEGDLLLTEGGDADKLGRSAIWHDEVPNCIHQNHIFRARMCSADIAPEWVMLCTNSPYGRDYFLGAAKQTTNLASINMTQLRGFPVPVPPKAEQKRILTKVEQLLTLCNDLAEESCVSEQLRERVLQAVLNGGRD